MQKDIGEQRNLAKKEASTVKRLSGLLREWEKGLPKKKPQKKKKH
jgi:hypothetical protein